MRLLKKTHHKKGLVEWLKVEALSSNPNTAKKKKKVGLGTLKLHKVKYFCSLQDTSKEDDKLPENNEYLQNTYLTKHLFSKCKKKGQNA
jgi:hypothetical protein